MNRDTWIISFGIAFLAYFLLTQKKQATAFNQAVNQLNTGYERTPNF